MELEPTVDYLSSDQFCALMRVSNRTLKRWRRAGLAPKAIRTGRKHLYSKKAIREWLAQECYEGQSGTLRCRSYLYSRGVYVDVVG